jgi:ATP-dependent exoDNAse (exonuclease V) alpha subunit
MLDTAAHTVATRGVTPILTDEFTAAFDLLENTRQNLFLTGKAGTGKSTFLHHLRTHSRKKIAVVAPTGVAALNVGGQTIHSFFRLKPGFVDPAALRPIRNKVLKGLELLVIDEISMVRADVFEGIDHTLRRVRHSDKPFGGVQVCAIGDLYQLPPVVTGSEAEVYAQHYDTAFFFSAPAFAAADFTTHQFTTIHRQSDAAFIDILNAIRAGTADAATLEALNARHHPRATPAPGTLVLTATNAIADHINTTKLAALTTPARAYAGTTSGDFGATGGRLPAPEDLTLKVGAQVMFVKNDSDGRWVNGTLGTVQILKPDLITVRVGTTAHEVKPDKWTTIRYEHDPDQDKIIEKPLGTYTQFPLTLAWAITIHKSQGKTLERVIIDLGRGAFAAGQLYVALSRCTTLDGIALKQPVTLRDVQCDADVVAFMQRGV